jgi:hypothetical protein
VGMHGGAILLLTASFFSLVGGIVGAFLVGFGHIDLGRKVFYVLAGLSLAIWAAIAAYWQ